MKEEGPEVQIQVAKGKGQAGKEVREALNQHLSRGRVKPPQSFGAKVSRAPTLLLGEIGNADFYM